MDIEQLHQLFLQCQGVSTDTRNIRPDSLFIAIKGDRFDANTFAEEALQKGARAVVIDNPDCMIDSRTVLVKDSLEALQELARFHRLYLKIPIVALTGSNGKTTTKELINVVLSQKFCTKATKGNLNNHIGVPLTLLSFDNDTAIGIVEMGANHQKEIEFLCGIAMPDYGYITNFGKAHLEGFGGVQGIIKGKSELYDYLSAHDKLAFVNLQDDIQVAKTGTLRRFCFGNATDADLVIKDVSVNPFVLVHYGDTSVQSQLIGLYNANNISAAIAIGKYFGVGDNDIKSAIESYVPDNNRSQLMQKGSNEIILDAYNANPSSMKAAIENFATLDKRNKIMILGDMFELGTESEVEHHALVEQLTQLGICCFLVGQYFFAQRTSATRLQFFENFESMAQALEHQRPEQATILIKGSRGMALERVLEFL